MSLGLVCTKEPQDDCSWRQKSPGSKMHTESCKEKRDVRNVYRQVSLPWWLNYSFVEDDCHGTATLYWCASHCFSFPALLAYYALHFPQLGSFLRCSTNKLMQALSDEAGAYQVTFLLMEWCWHVLVIYLFICEYWRLMTVQASVETRSCGKPTQQKRQLEKRKYFCQCKVNSAAGYRRMTDHGKKE